MTVTVTVVTGDGRLCVGVGDADADADADAVMCDDDADADLWWQNVAGRKHQEWSGASSASRGRLTALWQGLRMD